MKHLVKDFDSYMGWAFTDGKRFSWFQEDLEGTIKEYHRDGVWDHNTYEVSHCLPAQFVLKEDE